MTAAARNTGVDFETWKLRLFTLKAGQHAYQGDAIMGKTADGKVYPGPSASGYKFLGVAAQEVDASSTGPLGSVDQPINVDLMKERLILWRANDGTITAANLFSTCYFSDPNTVSLNSASQSQAGTIMGVDTVLGVAFEVEGL